MTGSPGRYGQSRQRDEPRIRRSSDTTDEDLGDGLKLDDDDDRLSIDQEWLREWLTAELLRRGIS